MRNCFVWKLKYRELGIFSFLRDVSDDDNNRNEDKKRKKEQLKLTPPTPAQVTMRLRAFYDDACFTVAAQDAFLSGFAAEVAHALNIKVELVIDLNAFHTEKHNEMEVCHQVSITDLRESSLPAAPLVVSPSVSPRTMKLFCEVGRRVGGVEPRPPPMKAFSHAGFLVPAISIAPTSMLSTYVYIAAT